MSIGGPHEVLPPHGPSTSPGSSIRMVNAASSSSCAATAPPRASPSPPDSASWLGDA